MEILWGNHKIKNRAEKIAKSNPLARRRLKQLQDAPCFLDIPHSARAHFLKGDMERFFAVDFVYPARLICEPCGEYIKNGNQFEKTTIVSIEIFNIETDYHSS